MEEIFRKKERSIRKLLRLHLLIGLFFVIYIFLIDLFHLGCPIRIVTGIPCPACGMTRAWICAVQLNFDRAFSYHPLFLLGPPLLFFAIHKNSRMFYKISLKVKNAILIVGGILFFVTYLLRMLVFRSLPI